MVHLVLQAHGVKAASVFLEHLPGLILRPDPDHVRPLHIGIDAGNGQATFLADLFPFLPDPTDQRLVYSYAVSLQQVTQWESSDFHPILLGMAETWLDTGDFRYLVKGVEQIQAAHVHGDLENWDARLDCLHFLAVYRDWALGL